ncbi:GTPase, G3E family [Haematococcus lacustris]|uniref:GTPase, G3E family n=1 Tax=Haematococcus lacustris TaxID=44745 RepID=A0A699YMY6_HAELA|nr:GTPase, G3E family [Haematococcus lacustris]
METAADLKAAGCSAFAAGDTGAALRCFTAAIQLLQLYSNRAAVHGHQGSWVQSRVDAQRAITHCEEGRGGLQEQQQGQEQQGQQQQGQKQQGQQQQQGQRGQQQPGGVPVPAAAGAAVLLGSSCPACSTVPGLDLLRAAWEEVEFADVVLLNKIDLAGRDGGQMAGGSGVVPVVEAVEAAVRGLNPRAHVLRTVHGRCDPGNVMFTGR